MSEEYFIVNDGFYNNLLTPLSKICDRAVFHIKDSIIFTTGVNDLGLIFYGENTIDTNIPDGAKLAVGDINKLKVLFNYIKDRTPKVIFEKNKIVYKSPDIRFRYLLLDDGIIQSSFITKQRIDDFDVKSQFTLSHSELMKIIKAKSANKEAEKAYFFLTKNKVVVEITDKTLDLTDSFAMTMNGTYSGEDQPRGIAVDINILSIISQNNFDFNLKYNGNALIAESTNVTDSKTYYIFSELKK